MKIKNLLSIALMAISFTVFGHGDPVKVDTKKSTIQWVGKKITGEHSGTIGIQSGSLIFHGKTIESGQFVIDMKSLQVTDLKAEQGKEKLEGHLNSDDFFGVSDHPTATLKIKGSKAGKAKGNLTVMAVITIKGIDQDITFDAKVAGDTITADIVIDRTKHDIKYGSGSFFDNLGDKTISDEFTLNVRLVF